jgi:preprotein translocase subunit SecF
MVNINFTKYSKVYYIFSGLLVVAAFVCFFLFGLKFGIEFTGGSSLEAEFKNEMPSNDAVAQKLADLNLGDIIIQPLGQNELVLRLKAVNEETHQQIVSKLGEFSGFEEKSFELIGPQIGQELKGKTELAIILTLLSITIYITFAFRKISRPVSSMQYGVASLLALFHDVIIPLGVFSVLGKFYNVEITIPVVAAFLTILGFSVHDTIVIFDRIRENLLKRSSASFEETVNWSLSQTLGRSINTVITVLLVLLSIFFFGGLTLRYFSLALIIGITSGAYSSIFIASPILVSWYKHGLLRRNKK